jgi:hypothetical protein
MDIETILGTFGGEVVVELEPGRHQRSVNCSLSSDGTRTNMLLTDC